MTCLSGRLSLTVLFCVSFDWFSFRQIEYPCFCGFFFFFVLAVIILLFIVFAEVSDSISMFLTPFFSLLLFLSELDYYDNILFCNIDDYNAMSVDDDFNVMSLMIGMS